MKYIVANWKANKNLSEVTDWFEIFHKELTKRDFITAAIKAEKITLIVCPAFPYLIEARKLLSETGVKIGAQTVSTVESGSATGEVTGNMLKGIVEYVIIGHSERRSKFNEDDSSMAVRIAESMHNNLKTILCVRDNQDTIDAAANVIAYEPVSSIGSGQNMPANEVLRFKQSLAVSTSQTFLYGGSVTRENAKSYLDMNEIDGLLIGSAALDPLHFLDIAELCK